MRAQTINQITDREARLGARRYLVTIRVEYERTRTIETMGGCPPKLLHTRIGSLVSVTGQADGNMELISPEFVTVRMQRETLPYGEWVDVADAETDDLQAAIEAARGE